MPSEVSKNVTIYECKTPIVHDFQVNISDKVPTFKTFDYGPIASARTFLEVLCFTSEDGLFHRQEFTLNVPDFQPTENMIDIQGKL